MLELLDRQQKLTANQWKVAAAATVGDMVDFFDFFLIGFVLAFIVKDWHLTYGEAGIILLASGISAPFGSLFWGWLADKIGRRTVMMLTVLNFSLATGAMALTPNGAWMYLAICRLIVGLGVTGLYSVDITMVQEFVPCVQARPDHRPDHVDAAGRRAAGRVARRLRHTLYRLARLVRHRPAAGRPEPLHPQCHPRIAALAAAHGPRGGSAPFASPGPCRSIRKPSRCPPRSRSQSTRAGPRSSNIRAASSPAA